MYTLYFTARSAALAFSYVPHVAVPLSIMVSTTGFISHFISSLIASIREDGMAQLCQRSAWACQISITISKTIIFFHVFVNFEIFKQCHFVTAEGKYFKGKVFTNGNWFVKFVKIFPLKKTRYMVYVCSMSGYMICIDCQCQWEAIKDYWLKTISPH